jgi:transposase
MMVALWLYAYARGPRSWRQIERACEEDIACRVLAAQQRPDHATIARFIERHQEGIAGLFGEVLSLCATRRLASVGDPDDGCWQLMSSMPGRRWSRGDFAPLA